MADILPPAPINEVPNSYGWVDWYVKLRTVINNTNDIPWASVNKAGSALTDIQTRNHNDLQNMQGGGASERYHLTAAEQAEATSARSTRGVDSTDYLITTSGLVLKSPNNHYWVASISNLGIVTWTDVGTTKP
jgi:hypothetical protein